MRTSILDRRVLIGLFVSSLLLGGANNLVNADRVDWIGSPAVLPKPEGWPTLSVAEGVAAGVREAWTGLLAHPLAVSGALLVLALGLAWLRTRPESRRRFAMSWWRVFFALMFLAAAWPKFSDPEGFATAVAQYQMLPAFSVNLFSVWLPALEITVGLALLLTPWERESSFWLGVLMVMFIVALAQALARELGIACGCFDIKGATDAGQSWFALLRDIVLMPAIAWMWCKSERRALWRL